MRIPLIAQRYLDVLALQLKFFNVRCQLNGGNPKTDAAAADQAQGQYCPNQVIVLNQNQNLLSAVQGDKTFISNWTVASGDG